MRIEGALAPQDILGANLFDFERAQNHPLWAKRVSSLRASL